MRFWLLSIFIVFCVLFLHTNCTQQHNESKPVVFVSDIPNTLPLIKNDTVLSFWSGVKKIDISIILPETEFRGTILALPGWNYPSSHWIDSTRLKEKANREGYILILPNMEKSIYSAGVYPETRKDWQEEVTRTWFTDSVIHILQRDLKILLPEQQTFILGLSTGGRGALFLALDNPNTFDAGASLSGDFDPSCFPENNLYRGFFGEYKDFKNRWEESENPLSKIEQLNTPFYIGHGLKDRIVPIKHSELFYDALGDKQNNSIFHIDSTAGHNYEYWDSEIDAVIDFFKSK